MTLTLCAQLQEKLAEYTSGLMTREEFRTWFAPVLRDVQKLGDLDAEKLAHAVEWEFCDVLRGASEQTLKENLARLASVAVGNPPQTQSLTQRLPERERNSRVQVVVLQFLTKEVRGSGSVNTGSNQRMTTNVLVPPVVPSAALSTDDSSLSLSLAGQA
ncbi:MAG TPA: hypothetical protein VGR94_09015 [Candidatus Acidoferrales bacterium]|nr:hypothetical protein [Candidatus Acidoferrales bacterium]